jgi:hypothetical protein
MLDFFINPLTAFIFIFSGIIFFRKEKVTIGQAFMFFLKRAALNFQPKINEYFTSGGIALLSLGTLIAFLEVVLW